MIVGDFELFTEVTRDLEKTATIMKKHEVFRLSEEDIYHLEFVVQEAKRQLKLN